MEYITRKSLLYKTKVEYGDYTINHVQGCYHGCLYPCYAYLMAKRFGRVKRYSEWIEPKLVINAEEILKKEVAKLKGEIESVHLCFTTDPFMYGYDEVKELSLKLIKILNDNDIKCSVLTKGVLPYELTEFSKENELGVTLISLNEAFRVEFEPNTATYIDRVASLKKLHMNGMKTWVSIEPYPTANIIAQDFNEILDSINFVDKIVFGRLNYNSNVSKYPGYKDFYRDLSFQLINFCDKYGIQYHIKKGTR